MGGQTDVTKSDVGTFNTAPVSPPGQTPMPSGWTFDVLNHPWDPYVDPSGKSHTTYPGEGPAAQGPGTNAAMGGTGAGGGDVTPTSQLPSTPTVAATTEAGIAQEKYNAGITQIGAMQEAQGTQLLGLETEEATAEGGIKASAAARGLKMEGSPLMALISQQQRGAQALQYQQTQGGASIMAAGTEVQAAYDTANLSGQEQIQSAEASDASAWLSFFGDVAGVAGKILTGGLLPSPALPANESEV